MLFEIYKKSFLAGTNAIWWGGETHDRLWDDSTIYLYSFIVLITFIISSKCYVLSQTLSNKTSVTIGSKKSIRWYYILTLFLLCILGLRGSWVGMDTIIYSQTFENATSLSAMFNDGSTTEPLYKIFQFLLRSVFSSRYIAIFIFSSLIIFFVFNTITKYYYKICITIAIPAFVCLYYFQSFNLIRITLAASFMLWSLPLIVEEKYYKYVIRILIATLIHYSSIVLLFPMGLLMLYKRNKKLAYCVALFSIFVIVVLTSVLGGYISLLNRYESYITGNELSGDIGLALFIDYIPCLYISYYIIKRKINDSWADLMVCFTIAAFIIRLSAYYISAAGRLAVHFMPLTIIFLPYWLNYIRNFDRTKYRMLLLFCIVWLLLRLHIYLIGYIASDGIMPYYFFWNEQ